MFKINKNSIVFKFSVMMLGVVFLQSTFLMGSVLLSGVVSSIRDNAFGTFGEKVSNRRNFLQEEMNTRWNNINSFTSDVSSTYNEFLDRDGGLDSNNKNEFLTDTVSIVVSMMRATMSTGGFIILDDNSEIEASHSCVYLKDYDPTLNNNENKDLYMLRGPVEVSRSIQIPLEKTWSYGITLDENTADIFTKPYEAANISKNPSLLGYWKVSSNLAGNGISMLTYSIPLIDKNGNPFGVMGIELSQEYFYKMLPRSDFSDENPLGYILASYNEKSGQITPIMTQGSLQKEIATLGAPLKLSVENQDFEIYEITNSRTPFRVLCNSNLLKIYNNNTPFENEQWVLMGLISSDDLLGFSETINHTFVLTFIVSIVLGAIFVFFVSMHFTKPITSLAKQVNENENNTVISLERTGLSEIDMLSSAIESLNKNTLDAVLKTEKIIDLVKLPLGSFEYKKNTDYVTLSNNLFSLLKIPKNQNSNTVDSSTFFDLLSSIKKNVEDYKNNIYLFDKDISKWVKIESFENEDGILGVVMDVSKDIFEKHTIIRDRDYDPLTKIYNRFSFKREVQKILDLGIESCAAFIMFDLDNLKYINDTYGHDCGDNYIRSAANIIASSFSERAVVGRMSGDEFYVFLYDYDNKEEIRKLLKTLYETLDVQYLMLPGGNEFKIRMSCGVSWYNDDSVYFDELTRYADFAMYQGKHTVKGEIREFDKDVFDSEFFMLSGREELNKVLDNQLVEFAFQPIICAKTGKLYAYESLIRPQSDVLNTPRKLIQIATSQSRLWQIEKITFFKTLATYMKYFDLFNGCKIFLNSVPNQILKDSEYREIELLYGEILSRVVVEIIENEKLDSSILKLKKDLVSRWGGELALDDYGSGYNGDISLISISPQILKLDRILIEGVEYDSSRQSIINKLLGYAKEQDILVLAEGVETKGQLEYVVNAGIDLLQGFYIGIPKFVPDFNNEKIAAEILAIHEKTNSKNLEDN